ncbi:hypothetical protein F5Y01DRAFT_319981 [Xylaria sp. FL0043]|nr:hypothetical protein F5Y01DRAFT_319981 [Xylaria sp. FL0043]
MCDGKAQTTILLLILSLNTKESLQADVPNEQDQQTVFDKAPNIISDGPPDPACNDRKPLDIKEVRGKMWVSYPNYVKIVWVKVRIKDEVTVCDPAMDCIDSFPGFMLINDPLIYPRPQKHWHNRQSIGLLIGNSKPRDTSTSHRKHPSTPQ